MADLSEFKQYYLRYCIKTSNKCREAFSSRAFGEINDVELGSRHRGYAAKLSPYNKVSPQNKCR